MFFIINLLLKYHQIEMDRIYFRFKFVIFNLNHEIDSFKMEKIIFPIH